MTDDRVREREDSMKKKKGPSKAKAKEILNHGTVHGKALTEKQRGFMGVVASGKKPKRLEDY